MTARPRLLPIVIGAASGLLLLKLAGIVLGGAGEVSGTRLAVAQQAQTQAPQAETSANDAAEEPQSEPGGLARTRMPTDDWEEPLRPTDRREEASAPVYEQGTVSTGKSRGAILERLSERREELNKLEAELRQREDLLKATEKKVENRISELRSVEESINASIKKRDEEEKARFDGLIKMYSTMKPKDAARIFNRLDIGILVEVAGRIPPEQMGAIMAKMSSEKAEILTAAMVANETTRAVQNAAPAATAAELPKIVGTPQGN